MNRSVWTWICLYAAVIVAANVAIRTLPIFPVGFGYVAPAGALFAGLALSVRDGLHERAGLRGAMVAILAGAALSFALSPTLALASGSAFLVSEAADGLVYARLRQRSAVCALVVSNVVGAAIDSALFLWLAFGSLAYLPGQLLAKGYATAAVALVVAWRRRAVDPTAEAA